MAKTNHWGTQAAAAGMLVAVGMLLLTMLVVEARPAGATLPGNPGKIAYAGDDGTKGRSQKDYEIYTIKSDGGGKVKVTDNATIDFEPSYSPSGTKIVYSGEDGPNGDYEIYEINADGGGSVQLTNNSTDDSAPSYSPSGKKIVYAGKDAPNGDYEIYTINAGGGGKAKLTDNATSDRDPSWGSG